MYEESIGVRTERDLTLLKSRCNNEIFQHIRCPFTVDKNGSIVKYNEDNRDLSLIISELENENQDLQKKKFFEYKCSLFKDYIIDDKHKKEIISILEQCNSFNIKYYELGFVIDICINILGLELKTHKNIKENDNIKISFSRNKIIISKSNEYSSSIIISDFLKSLINLSKIKETNKNEFSVFNKNEM